MGKTLRRFINLFLFTALLFFGSTRQVLGQESIEVVDAQVTHIFGEEIQFSAQIITSSPIKESLLIFREVGEENSRVISLNADEEGRVSYTYDASENFLHPFDEIIYWFQIELENGESFTSPKYFFTYTDNRYEWETREADNLRVHWYKGDEAFGLSALDTARVALTDIRLLFPVDTSQPIDIYIYASPNELQNALFMGGETWVAGHADPALGIVFMAIAPGEQENILMQEYIPHEMAHILLYRYVGENYNLLPIWFLEGTASIAELYPNPDYELALERATEGEALISIADLCLTFPREESEAFLAYAESTSFTRYLYANYGYSGMNDLIDAYANGLSCEAGTVSAFGETLEYLNADWQESVLGANLSGVAFRAILPYLLILALLIIVPLISGVFVGTKNPSER